MTEMPLPGYNYDSAIRQRQDIINQQGASATLAAQQAMQRRLAAKQASEQAAAVRSQASVAAQQQGQIQSANNATQGFDKFMQAISAQESGGNYGAINKMSGAMGKYQIMPSNILGTKRGWDWEVLGRDINTAEFINSPEIQEQIARAKLQGYYNKYGPAGAAIAWYAGPGAAQKYASSGRASTRGEAGGHPSVSGYMQSILKKMGYA